MEIDKLRKEIDNIDDKILELFQKRMDIAKEIAKYKVEHNLELYQRGREEEIIKKAKTKVSSEYADYVEDFMKNIMYISKKIQANIIK